MPFDPTFPRRDCGRCAHWAREHAETADKITHPAFRVIGNPDSRVLVGACMLTAGASTVEWHRGSDRCDKWKSMKPQEKTT